MLPLSLAGLPLPFPALLLPALASRRPTRRLRGRLRLQLLYLHPLPALLVQGLQWQQRHHRDLLVYRSLRTLCSRSSSYVTNSELLLQPKQRLCHRYPLVHRACRLLPSSRLVSLPRLVLLASRHPNSTSRA